VLSDCILHNLRASSFLHHDAEIEVVLALTTAVMWTDYSFVLKKWILRHDFDVQSLPLLPDVVVVIVK